MTIRFMKKNIDLLSNAEVLSQFTTNWCRQNGIKPRDLGCTTLMTEEGKLRPYQNAHPVIDDVIILIKFRDAFWSYMNKHQKKSWECWWKWAYTLKKPSRQKHLTKMASMAMDIENTILFKNIRKQSQREKIKSLRHIHP